MLTLQFAQAFKERRILLDNVLLCPWLEWMVIRHLIDSFDTVRPADFMEEAKTSDSSYPRKQIGCPSDYVHSFFNDRFQLG